MAFLNEYTTLMADVVTRPGLEGTIDKYIGDSVMAFWGAPLPQPDHAHRALLAALTCQERLRPFCEGLVARGGPRLITRIGLNSGVCVVGNMGSRDRFDYTAIGNTVNQASHLEETHPEKQEKRLGADQALRTGSGDCDEFMDLFITLARMRGVPCRRLTGYFIHQTNAENAKPEPHAWGEILSPLIGWAPMTLHYIILGTIPSTM